MKSSPFPYIIVTTVILITVTVMAALNLPFNWIFYLVLIGEISLVLMVYKTLKDKYTTKKTFDDFYEDHPNKDVGFNDDTENYR